MKTCDKGSKSRAWNIRFRIQSNNSLRVSRSMVLSSCFCEGGRPAIYAHSVQPGIKAYSSWLGSKRPPRMLLGLSAYIGHLSSVHLTTPDHSSSYCYCAVRISCVDTTNVAWHNRRVTQTLKLTEESRSYSINKSMITIGVHCTPCLPDF